MQPDQEISLDARAGVAAIVAVLPLVPFALLAALVVGGWEPLHSFDRSVTDRLHEAALDNPALTTAMNWWTNIFQPNVFRLAALLLVIWLVRRGARRPAVWVAVTMAVGGLLGGAIKLLVGRDRPDLLEPVARAVGYAFPSGHALNAALGMAVFVVIFPRVRALWVAAVLIPVGTAISRVVLGVHWTSDVVAGLLLGAVVPAITLLVFRRAGVRHRRPASVRSGPPG
ncbi:phosphatase PAP2 family protein [Actinoplanes lobatus]|uniref:Phosphatase PAP2 family protein n=1 Tax=Actinoplanes lobatus TaxID=113568 RepID=A0A7W7MLH6_9ACTN|nr:phosphatase PAP2 family protein [Actinoplanes lobatus]MBB4754548.1 undecaprenyl-diphosphatase [Actinoplanes lobatus]GGN66205.1 phosphatase PAP2 family protein [Actinoplanes lobatus]GIE45917.1 phosphatase PAP2 family protein [Actinoplanes lobatus]